MNGTAMLRGALACLCCLGAALLAMPTVTSVASTGHIRLAGMRQAKHPRAAAALRTCRGADTPATAASVADMSTAVDCLVNRERVRFGLPLMAVSADLNTSAQRWTERMVVTGRFTHGGDRAFGHRVLAAGFNWGQAGENIATGYLTPRAAVAAWMASPDHCRNILDPGYREVGTGESPAAVGGFASGPATWTQDMGSLIGQEPLSRDHGPQDRCPYAVASSG